MSGAQVGRTDQDALFRNHEDRILRLERAPSAAIYVDDRVITAPVPVVTFAGFPSDGKILELTWEIETDSYPSSSWLSLLFNSDYPANENDYRWRLFGDATADSDADFNAAGALGGTAIGGYGETAQNWGYVRFPDYNADSFAHGIIYQGEGGLYDGASAHTWIISGCGDPATPLTELHVFASLAGSPDSTNIVAPSRLTLTCY